MAKSSSTTKVLELVVIGVLLYEGWKHQDVIKGWLDKFSSSLQNQLGGSSSSTGAGNTNTDTSGTGTGTGTDTSGTQDTSGSTPDTSSVDNTTPGSDIGTVDNTGNNTQAAPDTSTQVQAVPAPAVDNSPGVIQPAPAPSVAVSALNCPQVIGPGCPDCCNINGNCVCKGNSNCPCNGCPSTVGTCAGDVASQPVAVIPARGGRNVIPVATVQHHLNPRQRGLEHHHPVRPVPIQRHVTSTHPVRTASKIGSTAGNVGPHVTTIVRPAATNARTVAPTKKQTVPRTHVPNQKTTIVQHPNSPPSVSGLPPCNNNAQCGTFCNRNGIRNQVVCNPPGRTRPPITKTFHPA